MTEKEKALVDKIKALFDYRDFDHLYELGQLSSDQKSELEHKLIALQKDIYYLDEYLESNWTLDRAKLDEYWLDIHKSLADLGVQPNQYDDYSRHIYKYQRHEEQLREKIDMLRLTMEYFYFYKSCDVKLLRRLIYDHASSLSKHYSLSDWRYFDLITEVNDDVDDLIEDTLTINGNRLLLMIRQVGVEQAVEAFESFMQYIGEASHERLTVRGASYQYIHERTMEQVIGTQKLLHERIAEYLKREKVSA